MLVAFHEAGIDTASQISLNYLMTDTTWFNADRFGMFIHWGLYAKPAGIWKGKKIARNYSEWLQASEQIPRQEYRCLTNEFNPSHFDADAWISEARNAGMRYFLITAKHHDGFCLWPTQYSDYNVVDATPFKRDILGELATACRKYGIKLGFYYSHWMDWDGTGGDVWYDEDRTGCEGAHCSEYQHPSQGEFESYWQNKCLPQIRELIQNYDPRFFWFDSWGKDSSTYMTTARQEELITLIRTHSKECLINSRINFESPSDHCDYLSMMDNCFPDRTFSKPWETSGTLNHSWAYHQLDFNWKPTEQLIKYLVGNAALGGNYQLNVGPMPDGRFEAAAIRRLREIGCWMDVNGESIHGTAASTLPPQSFGKVTMRKEKTHTTFYLHLWNISPDTDIIVEGIEAKRVEAHVLESGQPVKTKATAGGIRLSLPKDIAGLNMPVIKVEAYQ